MKEWKKPERKRRLGRLFAAVVFSALMMLVLAGTAFAGAWRNDGYGWWFDNGDGTYPKNGMYTVEGDDYIFDGYGYIKENQWVMENNRWYYCTGSGAVAKNTWISNTYYVDGDGIMLTNTWTPDGYWVDELGAWDPTKTKSQDQGIEKVNEYYTIDGNWDNRDQSGFSADRRVDMWIDTRPDDVYLATMNFGLYTPTGTTYDLYDKQNPNGDTLNIATADGLKWGGRSTISEEWYELEYNGKDTITLEWRSTLWTSGKLIFKRRSGGTLMSSWDDGKSYVPDNDLETYSVSYG